MYIYTAHLNRACLHKSLDLVARLKTRVNNFLPFPHATQSV